MKKQKYLKNWKKRQMNSTKLYNTPYPEVEIKNHGNIPNQIVEQISVFRLIYEYPFKLQQQSSVVATYRNEI